MSRWHTRLAELRASGNGAIARVQNVQFVQSVPSTAGFERFEHFEQPLEPHAVPSHNSTIDGNGGPREWAEALARLDPAKIPRDLPEQHWLTFITDCHRFIEAGWATRAAALGWRPLDLFGCDRLRPYARIDRAGLLWLLHGRKLVALARSTAVIETSTGARQTYNRSSAQVTSAVLAWELDR
jgi:hypothetical protein